MSTLDAFFQEFDSYVRTYDYYEGQREQQRTIRLEEIGSRIRQGASSWSMSDLKEIVIWKRLKRVLPKISDEEKNPPVDVEKLLRLAFEIQHERMRMEVLDLIKGAGPAVISAMLMFTDPEAYGVIDYHAWNALSRFGRDLARREFAVRALPFKESGEFRVSELVTYLSVIRSLARCKNTTARNVDRALYGYDKVNRTREWKKLANSPECPLA